MMINTIVASFSEGVTFVIGQTFQSDKSNDKEKYCKLIDSFNVLYSSLSISLFTVMTVLCVPFVRLYTAGLDQNYVYEALPFLFLAIEFLTVGRESMMKTIEVAGHFQKTKWRAIIETILNLACSIVAILIFKHIFGPIGGLYGTLVGTVCAMIYRTIDMNIYGNKIILKRSSMKSFWVMAVSLFCSIYSLLLMKRFITTCDSYITFFITGIITTPLVTLFCFMFFAILNPQECNLIYNFLRNRNKGKQ